MFNSSLKYLPVLQQIFHPSSLVFFSFHYPKPSKYPWGKHASSSSSSFRGYASSLDDSCCLARQSAPYPDQDPEGNHIEHRQQHFLEIHGQRKHQLVVVIGLKSGGLCNVGTTVRKCSRCTIYLIIQVVYVLVSVCQHVIISTQSPTRRYYQFHLL